MFWTYDHEAIPCRVVVDVNFYTTKKGSTKRSSMWEQVADTLNKCAVPKFRVDKRSVRDHMENLVYKRKKKLQAGEKSNWDYFRLHSFLKSAKEYPSYPLGNQFYSFSYAE